MFNHESTTTASRGRRRYRLVLLAVAAIAASGVGAGGAVASAPAAGPAQATTQAYSLLTAQGKLIGYGGAFSAVVKSPASAVVGVASTRDGHGAYAAEANGAVIALGDAKFRGSMAGTALVKPIVGIAVDPATGGYWLVASDGGIFTFGGARFHGSTGSKSLVKPIVGMAAAADGQGYWLVASDGGIFTFGSARFHGSTGAERLVQPIIAMSATRSGRGYWLVASDGGIFTFGDAVFYGSAANLGTEIVGMATGTTGNYGDPLRAVTGLSPARVDQGVDYAGSGPIYAVGDGIVNSTTGNWPGGAFISYRLTDGPAVGKMVYVAENVTPMVKIGQSVTVNTVLGILHNAYPYMEIGWAADKFGDTMASAAGQWTDANDAHSDPTAYGANFNALLVSLGAPSGIFVHPTVIGTVAAGWPTW